MADDLKTLLAAAGLTLEGVSSSLSLHPDLLPRIVNNRQPLPIGLARRLAVLAAAPLGSVLAGVPSHTHRDDAILYRPVPPNPLRGDPLRVAAIAQTVPVATIPPPLIFGAMLTENAAQDSALVGTVGDAPPVGINQTMLEYWIPTGFVGDGGMPIELLTSWTGGSGTHDWTSVVGAEPLLDATWDGGLECCNDDTNTDRMTTGLTSMAGSYTFGFTVKPFTGGAFRAMVAFPHFSNLALYCTDGGGFFSVYENNVQRQIAVAVQGVVQRQIWVLDAVGGDWELFVDGVSQGTAVYNAANLNATATFGALNSGAEGWTGRMRAMAFFEGIPANAGEVAALDNWLNQFI